MACEKRMDSYKGISKATKEHIEIGKEKKKEDPR